MLSYPFEIVTFDGTALRGDATSVSVQTPQGEITILPHHLPLITAVVAGESRITLVTEPQQERTEQKILVTGAGFLEVTPDSVTLLVRTSEPLDMIDTQRAEEAIRRAQQRLLELSHEREAGDSREIAETSALIARNLARLQVHRRRRSR